MKLVKVTWIDAIGADGWIEPEEIERQIPCIHTSVGYVVKETEGFITITMSYDDKMESLGAWLLIPKVMVVKVTEL